MSADDSQSTTSKGNVAPASKHASKKAGNSNQSTASPTPGTTSGGATLATSTLLPTTTDAGASTVGTAPLTGDSSAALPTVNTSSFVSSSPTFAHISTSVAHQASQPSTAASSTLSQASSSVAAGASQHSTLSTGGNHHRSFSTAALAGAIVGSIIGASLVTFLVTFVIFGKRKQQRHSSPSQRGYVAASTRRRTSEGHTSLAEKTSSRSDHLDWQAYLPQSADDRSIQNAVKTLFDQIELHVDNYYRKASVEPDDHTRQVMSQLDTNGLPGPIVNLMQDPRVALHVIKHCIATMLIARMSPGLNPAGSLLPAYLAAAPSKVETLPTPSGEGLGEYPKPSLRSRGPR